MSRPICRCRTSAVCIQRLISGGCGSFFAIMIKSKAFADKRTVQSHRMVNQAIKDVFEDIHGLQLKTIADTD